MGGNKQGTFRVGTLCPLIFLWLGLNKKKQQNKQTNKTHTKNNKKSNVGITLLNQSIHFFFS